MNKKEYTDFGYEKVPLQEKVSRVNAVFTSVASQYDVMNDLMSAGLHRLWKRWAVSCADIHEGQCVLDLAGGTGDLSALIARKVGETGRVILTDINPAMIHVGRDRLLNQGLHEQIDYVTADAQALPFPNHYFSRVTMAFGLRNVTNKAQALSEIHRVLKPGGKMVILEFSKPHEFLSSLYDTYSFHIIPKIGEWVAHDKKSYEYLVESIRMHPDQETLKQMLVDAGFEFADYENYTGGVVAVHWGYKV